MDSFDVEDATTEQETATESPVKEWRLKYEAGTLQKSDFIDFFQKESRKYFLFLYVSVPDSSRSSLRCLFKEADAKAGIIDALLEFMLGDNPHLILEKLRLEGNTASVCGKVFKNGEPTYSCRECGMDYTCVLCVNCFKQSAHRYHKYKMSTSGGGGCCDCGDEEAWKKDHYCEEHLRGKVNPALSTIITDAIMKRCEIAIVAILTFCVNFLEIESNASLECLDGDGDGDDNFCTVLYNDESHTFDQVIQTLIKVAKCRNKDAMDIVANIDREGRAVVKWDTFFECSQLKEQIEKQSINVVAPASTSRAYQSLRVSVLHMRAVSCQQFALQLLSWFQEFLTKHCCFRKIFARAILDKKASYNIGHILEYDVKLWKTARSCWHRLLISGMLMEYDNKMALAQEFSRHYATVLQDFIRDDHEHSFSIVSLSVQLFTVPSIAHFLIANEGIFYKLLHTFYHESVEKYIQNKTLHFAKNMSDFGLFKRAAYILYDLKYILSFKPDVWNDDLREGFLDGCKALLRLLNVMQGMESVQRQTGQHMDYEPEWECAFNLHIKLSSTISLVLEWSASDREVLLKLYQMIMRYMMNNGFIVSSTKLEERSVAGHIAYCIVYDVASKPVSVHLPLSRFFAGIYLHLSTYELSFDNVATVHKRTPVEIMEPILCTQAMIAQVHSGMWRRNGYSLMHQLYFYRNVRCRAEMLDRDIVGMQIGASLMESNQYLIKILNKFNLIEWMQPDYEESIATTTTDDDVVRQLSMIDEFLELLIVIICERYVPGVADVTEDDRMRKEIIQLLCIKSFSHSELNRALPDSNNGSVLEDVIESVAIFKKPQQADSKGVYELKAELYDDYNMYFYHYTKEEKSKSEEMQRLRRKNKGLLVCCPPPKLPKLVNGFILIANLLQCDVMMTILTTVLDRAMNMKSKCFSENHLQKVLHLIGCGLQEEASRNYPFLSFYERSKSFNLLSKLEELSRSPRVEAHRDFILWTMKKFKELVPAEQLNNVNIEMQNDDIENNETLVTPLTNATSERLEKEERARFAAERRAKIMAQMQNAQKNFMKSNAEMFAKSNETQAQQGQGEENGAAAATPAQSMEWQEDISEEGAVAYNSIACLGVDRRLQQPEEETFKCILCFEDCTVSKNGPTLVYSAFIQKSMILKPETKYSCSVHTSSCGHVMHIYCWQAYYNNEETKEMRRPYRHRPLFPPPFQSSDFRCPYCRCLSNSVLPLTAPLSKYSMPCVIHAGEEVFPFDLWIEVMKTFGEELSKVQVDNDTEVCSHLLPTYDVLLKNTDSNANVEQFEKILQPVTKPEMCLQWLQFVHFYMNTVRQFTPNSLNVNENESLLWMWNTCIYTLQTMEVYMRAIDKPFKSEMSIRHKSCLSGLIRGCCLYASNLSQTDIKNLIMPMMRMLDSVFRQKGHSVLEWNCFSVMTSFIFMVPNMLFAPTTSKSVIVNGSMMEYYTLQLFFLANVVKAIVLFEDHSESDVDRMDVDEDFDSEVKALPPKIQENITIFYKKYNLAARRKLHERRLKRLASDGSSAVDQNDVDNENEGEVDGDDIACVMPISCGRRTIAALLEHVKKEMREFLRCSCLLFHYVTDVEFPDEFLNSGSDTYENMCKYLGLKAGMETYFDNESSYATMMEIFASHPDIVFFDFNTNKKRNAEELSVAPCTRTVPSLVPLPEDYSDLINSVSDFICPNNDREEMKTPTMCLVCGEILCGQSYCCQPELEPSRNVGACTYHSHYCGAGIGPFLRIRDCQIVYLGRNKGCFIQPPYLDEYGETDQGLRRGNPLRLCQTRYSKINLTWLGHCLHEEIARLNDNAPITTIQWHHM